MMDSWTPNKQTNSWSLILNDKSAADDSNGGFLNDGVEVFRSEIMLGLL